MSHFPLRLKTETGEVAAHSKKAVPEQGFVLSSGQGQNSRRRDGGINSLATHGPSRSAHGGMDGISPRHFRDAMDFSGPRMAKETASSSHSGDFFPLRAV
jgi:hypothetical protein